MIALAQESGGSLLPDWLRDAPPWVQVIGILAGLAGALGLATVALWGPALADRIRGRTAATVSSTTTPAPDSSAAPAGSPPTSSATGSALEQYDARMVLIDKLVSGLQDSLEDAEQKIDQLQTTVEGLREQLATARQEIGRLTYQRDLLLQQRADPPRRDA